MKLKFYDIEYIMKVFLEFKYDLNKKIIEEIMETN